MITVLPLVLLAGCTASATKQTPPQDKRPDNFCTPSQRVSVPGQQDSVKELLNSSKSTLPSDGECAALCESIIVRRYQQPEQPGSATLVGMEDLNVTSCEATAGAGVNQVQLDCELTFTRIDREFLSPPPGCPPVAVP